ncbi:hypothetical protein OKW21_005547 [Catalinimonas alkaloidigena]|uniref:TaqI family restriction endonuclease n=1 Tax=Catalinimonas alkaloidigena TaxID=1075417 RepID=UPI0024074A7C|nr:TaqI family restriction endonuclease [Catalinimonas alkaloidigena]MDF9800284.1 hypothetical protein [Catalinimonas alkaloidigena]
MLRAYLEFLCSLQLNHQLAKVKSFEADLKGTLNPSKLLNRLFFVQNHWLDFDAFFQLYVSRYQDLVTVQFPKLDKQQLMSGLKARLYRTQCGILTEYQAFLGAQAIFGNEHVHRSLELDQAGVDFTICHQANHYHIHIFVDTHRAWYYRKYKSAYKQGESVDGIHVDLPYALKAGRINSLYYLPNGFGVYTPDYLRYLQGEIYSGNLLQHTVSGVNEQGFIYKRIY